MANTNRSVAMPAIRRLGVVWGSVFDAESCLQTLGANERRLRERGEFARAREYRRMIDRYARAWTTSN
jgi:hypothetical protein